jgi:hypothetical protein
MDWSCNAAVQLVIKKQGLLDQLSNYELHNKDRVMDSIN